MEQEKQLTGKVAFRIFALFFLVFSLLVLIAIFFTDTTAAKITNLICGIILMALSGLFFYQSKNKKREAG